MDFSNRLNTIAPGFKYPSGYEPYDKYEGVIVQWMDGAYGLCKTSTVLTAIYRGDSTRAHINGDTDPVYKYIWPKSDEEYKFLI